MNRHLFVSVCFTQLQRKFKIILLFVMTSCPHLLANVNYIDFSKISSAEKEVSAFNDIVAHQEYYDHWSADWKYVIPKDELTQKLQEYHKSFSELMPKNQELYLLLGDIAHFLYNLDNTSFFDIAVDHYNSAIKSNPNDFRSYWFLGYHYALSNVPTNAVDNFFNAKALLPPDEPADFWNDFAWTTAVANMPSNCIFAMDKVKEINGVEGSFEFQLGETVYNRIIPIDKDSSYNKQDIWSAAAIGKMMDFTSRPLGIKILVDSSWVISGYDYTQNQSAFIITPPAISNRSGRAISYTVALLMKTADDDDQVVNYISNLIPAGLAKTKFQFSDKYGKTIAFEIMDKTMYQDMGGGHLYLVGVERGAPKYPGLLLEKPINLPENDPGEVHYYSLNGSRDRFKGRIFYAFMLDTCEDINKESFAVFKTLFEEQIIIE